MRIVHLLGWKLKSINSILPKIKEQGFDTIQINPMQGFKENNGLVWYNSYQPLNFEIGNCFGNEADLTSLCQEANKLGIKIVVDLVCNHVANLNGGEMGKMVPHPAVDPKILAHPQVFKPRQDLTEYDNKNLASKQLIGLPGLDLRNRFIQRMIFDYVIKLNKCGVSGLRIDAAKHIGLPSDGNYFFSNLKRLTDKLGMFSYSEFIGGTTPWRDEMAEYSMVYTGKDTEITDTSKKVTDIETHDTYLHSDGPTRNVPINLIIASYYALSHAFENTLFYVRPTRFPYDNLIPEEYNYYDIQFQNLNEMYYFDHSFLENPTLRYANESVADKRLALAFENRKS